MNNSDNKTKVEMKFNDPIYNQWNAGEIGYIDGYIIKDGKPCMLIIIDHRLILCGIGDVSVISQITYEKEL